MRFIQYIPPFVALELAKRKIFSFEFNFCSLNEFLGHPRIQFFTRDKNFKRFVLCRGQEIEVISELKDGRSCKIGVLDGDMSEIPEWNPRQPEEVKEQV
jgi:hypothetical protein